MMSSIRSLTLLFALSLPLALWSQLPNVGLLADMNPGTNSGSASNFIKLGSTMIFSASNGTTGTELWKTDGTAGGITLIKDIRPGTSSASINNLRVMGSYVYFTANDGTNGGALWRTDGTTAGTTMVKDINAGSTSSTSFITELTVIGSKLYFRGNDGVNGEEPWISDGTPSGTVMLKNIAPGSASSSGTSCPCAGTYEFVEFNGLVYFNANDQNNAVQQNSELWRTDGTTNGTVLFKDNYSFGSGAPANLVNAGSYLFFTADNQSNTGYEPWKTDGTVAGTVMIKDIFTTANVGSIIGDVSTAYMNGFVYFIAVDVYYPANFNLNPPQSGYINAELWRTDGTNAGTTKVKEINPGTTGLTADAFPLSTSNFLVVGNRLYMTATDGTNGIELWATDGTAANTIMLKNIDTAGDASPSSLFFHNGFVYFSADDNAATGREIWRTDGTSANTVLVKDINPGASNSSPGSFVSLDAAHLLFNANSSIYGAEAHILGGFKVALTTSANGNVSPPGIASTGNTIDIGIKAGASQTFSFNPDGGFSTQSVVVDGSSVGTPGNHTFSFITANHTLNVTFGSGAPTSYTITASAGTGGTISPSGAVSVNSGGSQTFSITPNSGFCIQSVTVNGSNQGAISSYTFSNVTSNQTISATFVAATTYYRDLDNDGFGNPSSTTTSCTGVPSGYVSNNTDCNDNSAIEKPGQVWYKDSDNDGYAETGAATITQCARPNGYKASTELTSTTSDCNDNNNAIKPGATEVCDGIDNNCNGSTDEGVLTTYYRDMDADGFGNPSVTQQACSAPSGYVTNNTDCDDNDALEKPGQIWYKDTDNDGYAQSGAATITQCLRPTGYKVVTELASATLAIATNDCNDGNSAINPAATEVCDGIDNNCNGITDEGVQTIYYRDFDNDGFGNANSVISACSLPSGYVTNSSDCNDNSAVEKPGQIWYKDTDNDGYAETGAATVSQCLRPIGYKALSELTSATGDCNDSNSAIYTSAPELCDGLDNNCNGSTDEGALTTFYRDQDNDGFGNLAMTQQACSAPSGYVANSTDCNDNDPLEKPGQVWYKDSDNDGYAQTGAATITQCVRPSGYKVAAELASATLAIATNDCNDGNPAINPAATEVCDGIDNNCNGSIDEGAQTTYYRDQDGDTFGNPANSLMACSQPSGYVTNNTDCNDNSAIEKPGQVWYKDTDNDGYAQTGAATITQCLRPSGYKAAAELASATLAIATNDCNDGNSAINPAATEVCDGIDNNCNGSTDEGVLTTYYRDQDGDTFGDPANSTIACSQPSGYVTNNTDCNDNNAIEKPGQVWYKDTDNDGYAQAGAATITQCLRPSGYKILAELASATLAIATNDCNDNNSAINPAATEVCDGVDNNCNGSTDEGVLNTYYRDQDGDGFGSATNTIQACSLPSGYVTNNNDCDDNDILEQPGQTWYKDTDNDGYSDGTTLVQCLRPAGYKVVAELTAATGDCNDGNNTIYPAAPELCDGLDNNCNGSADEDQAIMGAWSTSGVGTAGGSTSSGCSGSGGPGSTPVFNISATGVSTSSTDNQQFVYQTLCGDGSIIVHINSIDPTGGWAGIVMREDLSTGSKKVAIKKQSSSGVFREIRTATNGAATISSVPFSTLHTWLRIVRTGNNFSMYTSTNGTSWGAPSTVTIVMPSCIKIGMFAESINGATSTQAEFDNVSVTGSVSPLASPDIEGVHQVTSPTQSKVKVFPNPTSGYVQLDLQDLLGQKLHIKVSNGLGTVVINKQIAEAQAIESLDMSQLSPGVYWIHVQAEGNELPAVQKVILNK